VLLSEARVVSDAMISVSAQALADTVTDAELQRGLLFPSVSRLREVAAAVAAAVMRQAAAEGMGNLNLNDIEGRVEVAMWEPNYTRYIAAD
jgi:malic enzyme